MDSWYGHDLWYRHGLMALIGTHGIDMGHGKNLNSPMVPMVLTQTHGIVPLLLNNTYTIG